MAINGMVKRLCEEEDVGYVDMWDSFVGKVSWCKSLMSLKHPEMLELSGKRFSVLSTERYEPQCGCQEARLPTTHCKTESAC